MKLQLLEASDRALEGLSKLISELSNTVNLIESLEKKTQEFREAESEEAKAARKTAAEEILKVGRTSLESREDQIIKLNAAIDLIDSKLATSEDTKNEVQALRAAFKAVTKKAEDERIALAKRLETAEAILNGS